MPFITEFKKTITCEHCEKQFEATVSLEIFANATLGSAAFIPEEIELRRANQAGTLRQDQQLHTTPQTATFIGRLDASQKMALEMAERGGLVAAFENAFIHAHGIKPANVPKAFMGWLKLATPKLVAHGVLNYLKSEFGGRIDFVAHQSIGAVVSNGEVVHFLPCQLIGDSSLPGALRMSQSETSLAQNVENWVRTKHGYVSGKGAFFDALRKKSIGEFARPIL